VTGSQMSRNWDHWDADPHDVIDRRKALQRFSDE
jgi:hypothetical protein